MTSAFHRPGDRPRHLRQVTKRLHPALTGVLNRLEGEPLEPSFRDRAVELSTSMVFRGPLDHRATLAAPLWLLERAQGDGVPLTAAGYLTPTDVQALAAVLPTMRDGVFRGSREIDTPHVRSMRERMKRDGLLRSHKGSLRLTKAGRAALADPVVLWRHLADRLIPSEASFARDAVVVLLVHAATTTGERIDIDVVVRTLSALGWSHRDGSPPSHAEVHEEWYPLWTVIGNVDDPAEMPGPARALNDAARLLVHDALFEEVGGQATD